MRIRRAELERALRVTAGLPKPKDTWSEWILIRGGQGLVSQGIQLRVTVALPESDVEDGKEILLHEQKIRSLVPRLSADLDIQVTRGHVELVSGRSRSRLHALSPRSYPPGVSITGGKPVTIPLKPLQQAIRDVEFAIADDVDRGSKEAFMGLTMRSEGRMLDVFGVRDPLLARSRVELETPIDVDLTLPAALGQLLLRMEGETITVLGEGERRLFQGEGVLVAADLLPVRLMDLRPFMEKPRPTAFICPKAALQEAVRQIQAFQDRHNTTADLVLTQGLLRLAAASQTAGVTVSEVEGELEGLDGERLRTGIDIEYLASIIDRVRQDVIRLEVGREKELIGVPAGGQLYLAVTSIPGKELVA